MGTAHRDGSGPGATLLREQAMSSPARPVRSLPGDGGASEVGCTPSSIPCGTPLCPRPWAGGRTCRARSCRAPACGRPWTTPTRARSGSWSRPPARARRSAWPAGSRSTGATTPPSGRTPGRSCTRRPSTTLDGARCRVSAGLPPLVVVDDAHRLPYATVAHLDQLLSEDPDRVRLVMLARWDLPLRRLVPELLGHLTVLRGDLLRVDDEEARDVRGRARADRRPRRRGDPRGPGRRLVRRPRPAVPRGGHGRGPQGGGAAPEPAGPGRRRRDRRGGLHRARAPGATPPALHRARALRDRAAGHAPHR